MGQRRQPVPVMKRRLLAPHTRCEFRLRLDLRRRLLAYAATRPYPDGSRRTLTDVIELAIEQFLRGVA